MEQRAELAAALGDAALGALGWEDVTAILRKVFQTGWKRYGLSLMRQVPELFGNCPA